HLGLFLIAISQQLSDFAGPYGKALLRNSTQQLFLRQSPDELAYIKEAVRLSDAEVAAIARLKTVKRSYSQAYWINGTRGRRTFAPRALAAAGLALLGLLMLIVAPLALLSSTGGSSQITGGAGPIPAGLVPVFNEAARVYAVNAFLLASIADRESTFGTGP